MKTLVVSLVSLLFAFFVGCQSSITDPVNDQDTKNFGSAFTENFASKDLVHFTYPNVIDLKGRLDIPGADVESYAEIKGTVKYGLEIVYFDSPPPSPQSAIRVSMKVDADLKCNKPWDGKLWIVNNTSEDLVYMENSSETTYYLDKRFTVQNTCRIPLDLLMTFKVEETQLTVISAELKVRDGWVSAGDPGF